MAGSRRRIGWVEYRKSATTNFSESCGRGRYRDLSAASVYRGTDTQVHTRLRESQSEIVGKKCEALLRGRESICGVSVFELHFGKQEGAHRTLHLGPHRHIILGGQIDTSEERFDGLPPTAQSLQHDTQVKSQIDPAWIGNYCCLEQRQIAHVLG